MTIAGEPRRPPEARIVPTPSLLPTSVTSPAIVVMVGPVAVMISATEFPMTA